MGYQTQPSKSPVLVEAPRRAGRLRGLPISMTSGSHQQSSSPSQTCSRSFGPLTSLMQIGNLACTNM